MGLPGSLWMKKLFGSSETASFFAESLHSPRSGGGTVLDIYPPRAKRFTDVAQEFLKSIAMRRLDEIVMPLARRNRTLGLGEAELLSQTLTQKIQVKDVLNRLVRERRLVLLSTDPIEAMDVNAFEQLAEEVCQTLRRHHQREPLSLGISKEQLFSQIFKRSHPRCRWTSHRITVEGQEDSSGAREGSSLRSSG